MSARSETTSILCCLCGSNIEYNAAAMCIACLRQQVDITEGISRDLEVLNCGKCERWHTSGDNWHHMPLEGASLMGHCLKKLALDKHSARIVESSWIWTEPHSKRLKIAVVIQKEHLNVKLQQRVVVEYIVRSKQCLQCIRENTDHTWGAMVQVRQRLGGNKASLYQLETMLTKSGLYNLMQDVVVRHEGLDLMFKSKNQADRVVQAIMSAMPAQKQTSAKMVSQDKRANTKHMELTVLLEVVPVSKHDLVVLPRGLSGSRPVLLLCHKRSSNLHLISPQTLQRVELNAAKYFATPFTPLLKVKDLVEYVVMDVTPVDDAAYAEGWGAGVGAGGHHTGSSDGAEGSEEGASDSRRSKKANARPKQTTGDASAGKSFCLAHAEVARVTDLGSNGKTITALTHLGHLLSAGDIVLGYDLATANYDESALEGLKGDLPDVVLVRKVSSSDDGQVVRRRKRKPAPWMKKSAAAAGDEESVTHVAADATAGSGISEQTASEMWEVEDSDEYEDIDSTSDEGGGIAEEEQEEQGEDTVEHEVEHEENNPNLFSFPATKDKDEKGNS